LFHDWVVKQRNAAAQRGSATRQRNAIELRLFDSCAMRELAPLHKPRWMPPIRPPLVV
jgi:hypothetical protein